MGAVTQFRNGVKPKPPAERYAEVPTAVLPLIDIACSRTASARRLLSGFSTPVSKLKAKADLIEAQDAIKEALRGMG